MKQPVFQIRVACARMLPLFVLGFSIAATARGEDPAVALKPTPSGKATLRYPIALALANKEQFLLAANERSGSISIVDLQNRLVVGEAAVGKTLTDLVPLPGREDMFLATDFNEHQVVLLRLDEIQLQVIKRVDVSPFPVSIVTDKEGFHAYIASLWSRQLTVLELLSDEVEIVNPKIAATIPLPFIPRLQILAPDGKNLFVADAFGGYLATVDLTKNNVDSIHAIPAHNIRGLALSADGKRLFVSHQTLNKLAETSLADVHWGSVVANVVRSLDVELLFRHNNDVLKGSDLILLGDVDDGGGDPASVVATQYGNLYVALAGVGEVAVGDKAGTEFRRLKIGTRPTALLTNGERSRIYVADTFGDSVAVVHGTTVSSISLGAQRELTSAERGRRLFFSARLSHGSWMSCHSCHSNGHSSDRLSDTQGDGTYGTPKRIPSLGGVRASGPWGWNGNFAALSDQVRQSIETTMRGAKPTDDQVHDLVEFLKSLEPVPAVNAKPGEADSAAIERGRTVFVSQKCDRCHIPPTYTSAETYDVGLKDELGNSRFNPPSLRGVTQRATYFHDGRVESLEKVLVVQQHQLGDNVTSSQLLDLIAFLRSL